MGAFVSMQAAALAAGRIRRLVLIDGVGAPEPAVLPPILAAAQRVDAVYPSAEAYCERIRRQGAAQPWEELWKDHYLYELEAVPGGVRPRTSIAAVLEDAADGARQDPRLFWPLLRMPTLLVRAARPLLPGTGFVVAAALRDAFLSAVPAAEAVEIDANHYGGLDDHHQRGEHAPALHKVRIRRPGSPGRCPTPSSGARRCRPCSRRRAPARWSPA